MSNYEEYLWIAATGNATITCTVGGRSWGTVSVVKWPVAPTYAGGTGTAVMTCEAGSTHIGCAYMSAVPIGMDTISADTSVPWRLKISSGSGSSKSTLEEVYLCEVSADGATNYGTICSLTGIGYSLKDADTYITTSLSLGTDYSVSDPAHHYALFWIVSNSDTKNNLSVTIARDPSTSAGSWPAITTIASSSFALEHYRWREDISTSETLYWLADEDTALDPFTPGTPYRLRMQVRHVKSASHTLQFYLQYRINSGSWTTIGTGATGDVYSHLSAYVTDAADTTAQLTAPDGTFLSDNQSWKENDAQWSEADGSNTLWCGYHTEFEWTITPHATGPPWDDDDVVQFRLCLASDGSFPIISTVTPTATISLAAGATTVDVSSTEAVVVAGLDTLVSSATLVSADADAVTVTGYDTTVSSPVTVSATAGEVTVTGYDTQVTSVTGVYAAADAVTVTGHNPLTSSVVLVRSTADAVTITGFDTTVTKPFVITSTVDAVTVTGYNVLISAVTKVMAAADAVTITSFDVIVTKKTKVLATSDAVTVSGYDTAVTKKVAFTATEGAVTVTGYDATITKPFVISATLGEVVVAGYAAEVTKQVGVDCSAGAVVITGYDATVNRLFDERFEGTGYEETWAETIDGAATLDEDASTALVGSPSGWGDQCLEVVVGSGENCYIEHDFSPDPQRTFYARAEFCLTAEGMSNGQGAQILRIWSGNTILSVQIRQVTGLLFLRFNCMYDGSDHTVDVYDLELNKIYRVELKWDLEAAEFAYWLNGHLIDSGTISGTPLTWGCRYLRVGRLSASFTSTLYFDRIAIDSNALPGVETDGIQFVGAGAGAVTVTGHAAEVAKKVSVGCTLGLVSVGSYDASVATETHVSCTKGEVLVTGYAATITLPATVLCGIDAVTVTGYDTTVTKPFAIEATSAGITVTGYDTTVTKPFVITASAGAVVVTGYTASLGAATCYICEGGQATTKTAATGLGGLDTYLNITNHNLLDSFPGDTYYLSDYNGIIRCNDDAILKPQDSGTEAAPISYLADGSPILSGADLLDDNWHDASGEGAHLWYFERTITPLQVFCDDVRGMEFDTQADLISDGTDGDWWWDSSNQRVYLHCAAGDPYDTYTGRGVEITDDNSVTNCANYSDGDWDWIVWDGIQFEKAAEYSFNIYDANVDGLEIRNCTFRNSYAAGARINGDDAGAGLTNVLVEDCVAEYNGGHGIVFSGNQDGTLGRRLQASYNGHYEDQTGEGYHTYTGGLKLVGPNNDNFVLEDSVGEYQNTTWPVGTRGSGGNGIWTDVQFSGGVIKRSIGRFNNDEGIRIESTTYTTAYACLAYGNGGLGLHIAGNAVSLNPANYNKLYNCVAYSNNSGIEVSANFAAGCIGNEVKNCISSGNTYRELRAHLGGENPGKGFTLATTLNGATETTVDVGSGIPAAMAASGTIAIWLDNGSILRTTYSSHDSDRYFTIPSEDFSSTPATAGNAVGANSGYDNRYANNCFGIAAPSFLRIDGSNYDAYDTAIGKANEVDGSTFLDSNGVLEEEPQFADAASYKFYLLEGSCCIDAGINLGASYDDVLDPRCLPSAWPSNVASLDQDDWGSGWEIGAYVYDELSAAGAVVVTGYDPTVQLGLGVIVSANLGEVVVAGYDATVTAHTSFTASEGAVVVAGANPAITIATFVSASAGAVAVTAFDATVTLSTIILPSSGAVTITAYDTDITVITPVTTVSCTLGAVAVAGYDTAVKADTTVLPSPAAITVAGYAAGVTKKTAVAATAGAIAVTGYAAQVSSVTAAQATLGAVTVTGYAADVSAVPVLEVACNTGTVTVSAVTPVFAMKDWHWVKVDVTQRKMISVLGKAASIIGPVVAATLGTVAVTAHAASIHEAHIEVACNKGTVAVSGLNASSQMFGTEVLATLGQLAVTGYDAAGLTAAQVLVEKPGVVDVRGYNTIVNALAVWATRADMVVSGVNPAVVAPLTDDKATEPSLTSKNYITMYQDWAHHLPAPVARRWHQFLRDTFYIATPLVTVGGTANSIELTTDAEITQYIEGDAWRFVAEYTNTGGAVLDINNIGPQAVRYNDSPLHGGEIVAGGAYQIIYEGDAFKLVNSSRAVVGASGKTWMESGNTLPYGVYTPLTWTDQTVYDDAGYFYPASGVIEGIRIPENGRYRIEAWVRIQSPYSITRFIGVLRLNGWLDLTASADGMRSETTLATIKIDYTDVFSGGDEIIVQAFYEDTHGSGTATLFGDDTYYRQASWLSIERLK